MNIQELSAAAREVLESEETGNMRLINRVRYAAILLTSLPWLYTAFTADSRTGLWSSLAGIGAYLLVTVLHSLALHSGDIRRIRRLNSISMITDSLVLLALILTWGLAVSPDDFTFTAKTPAWLYFAVFISITVLQYRAGVVYTILAAILLTYAGVIAVMIFQGFELTGDWKEYVNGPAIDFADLVFVKPIVFSLVALVVLYSIRRSLGLVQKITEAETKRARLARYFSPSVVEDISAESAGGAAASRQKVTILFLDIRNFTRISESLEPETLVAWLSDFRARLTAIVFKHNGAVDKFIGDAIMATFGTPRPDPAPGRDSNNAVLCALEMLDALSDLDRDWQDHGIENRIGVGIHTGEVLAGNIGDSDQIEYSVIGDAVNTASRIEGLCKKLRRPIIISEEVRAELAPKIPTESLPRVIVKGKNQALVLHAVLP